MSDHAVDPATDVQSLETPASDDSLAFVARAHEALADLTDTSLDEHAERYRSVHADLQRALSDTDRT